MGSGCDSVGRVVPYDTRGSRFESSYRQFFMINIFSYDCWEDENKEKSDREWPSLQL